MASDIGMKYRPEIDGLRALAVISVILFHSGLKIFSGGFVGVDVFFVISGYLITTLILAERESGTFSLLRFYERRARRILPALFIVMFTCLPFAWLWLLPADMKSFSQSLVAISGFSSNIFFYLRTGYFEAPAERFPLLHTWSLAVEEQYYMFFPIVLLLCWKLGKKWLVIIFAVMAVMSFGVASWGASESPAFTFFLLPSRVWELLVGVFAAFYLREAGERKGGTRLSETAGITGLLSIMYAVLAFDKHTPFPGDYAIIPTAGSALIIIFATRDTIVGKVLGSRILVNIGLISYSAYLWHHPLFNFVRYRQLGELDFLIASLLIAMTFGLAYITWKFVEVPFRDRQLFSTKRIFQGAAICMISFLSLGVSGHAMNGFTERIPPDCLPHDYYQFAQVVPVSLKGADGKLAISTKASMSRVNIEPRSKRILLVGDSHSADYSIEYRSYAARMSLDAWQFSVGGCGFLPSQKQVSNGECGRASRLLEEVVDSYRFDNIIFIGAYYDYMRQCNEPEQQEDMEYLVLLLKKMLASGAHVIFFTPRHSFSIEPMRAAMINEVNAARIIKEPVGNYVDSQIATLAEEPNFTIFDERDLLINLGCGQLECFNGHTLDLHPLYRDTNHLTNLGAKLAFQRLTSVVELSSSGK